MNYRKHYKLLIEKRGNKRKPKKGYYERHHILPKALGGSNDFSNLVYLTAREHYLAHWLLWKIYRCPKTAAAFWLMGVQNRVRMSSRHYEYARSVFNYGVCCLNCKNSFSIIGFSQHIDACLNPKEYSCCYCNKKLSNLASKKEHEKVCPLVVSPSRVCPHCSNAFDKRNFNRHVASCRIGSTVTCSGCKKIISKRNIRQHERYYCSVLKTMPVCDYCKKPFYNNLQKHLSKCRKYLNKS